jgi:AraC-like DNA-binding protein
MSAGELLLNDVAFPQKTREDILALRIEMLCSPEKDWSVELLAEKAMLSPSYFQGLYKKAFGTSPIRDLIDARIKKAESYLLSSDKKESEIALLCGYKNVEHFLRQFKKSKGITPAQFRKLGKIGK